MATVYWALGIAGLAVLLLASSGQVEVKKIVTREKRYVSPATTYQSYRNNLSNPLFLQNRLAEGASMTRVSDTAAGLPQYRTQFENTTMYMSRLPDQL